MQPLHNPTHDTMMTHSPAMKQGTHALPHSAASSLCVRAHRCVPSLRAVVSKHSSPCSRHRAAPLVVAVAPSDDHEQPAQHMPEWLTNLMQPPAAVPALSLSLIPAAWIGGGSGGWFGGDGGDGGSGGNGGGSSGANQVLGDLAAESDDDDDEYEDEEEEEESEEEDAGDEEDDGPVPAAREAATLDNASRFYCAEIVATGLPTGKGAPTEEDLFAGLKCQPGFDCTREEVSEDLRTLFQTGLFNDVDARVEPIKDKAGRFRLTFDFKEKLWPEMKSFEVKGASLIPSSVVAKVMQTHEPGPTTVHTLARIKNIVEGWYQVRGYPFCYISHYDGMETGSVVANLVEGRTANVDVVRIDDQGQPMPAGQGKVPAEIILRELEFKKGQPYNAEEGRRALASVFGLGLFDNVQVLPKQSPKDETRIDVDVMVRERPLRTAEINAEWGFAPGPSGRPSLTSIVPGGSITFEDRNVHNNGSSLSATIDAPNFLQPGEDLGFRLEYKRPYIYGDRDRKKTAMTVSAFNVRKQSAVYKSESEDVPSVWVDRQGVRVGLHESYSRNSRGSLALVLEQISSTDESGMPLPAGLRQVGMGQFRADGPPTGHTDSGVDRLLLLQGSVTRDATYFLNGTPVGARDIFTMEQSLLGTGMPLFNRHTASATRFIKLRTPSPGSLAPPPMLVLHARAGNCIGDLAAHDLFNLGGPYSVRGYNVGELGSCRSFLETAVEARIPLLGKHVFAFWERGTDLGSSATCRGNPTQYFRKAGRGSSVGGGVRVGGLRIEYAVDRNSGKGNLFFRYGERY